MGQISGMVIGFILGLIVYNIFFCSQQNEEEIIAEVFKEKIDIELDILRKEYSDAIKTDVYGKIDKSNAEEKLNYFITKILGLDKDSRWGIASYNYIKKNI